jgi:PEGA domain
MTDGLGLRVAATDSATGEPVEHLELVTDLVLHTAFASSLADRVARLASVRHASYVRVRRVDRPAIDRLVVVSDATAGRRLSELLDASEAAAVRPDIDAVVALLRQLLPAVALYSRHNRDQALGTIAPERLFIAPPARVVIADAAFGPAIDHLTLSRSDAWRRFRVAAPPSDAPVVSTPRGDATALGVVTLAMLHGRRLTEDEFPEALPALVASAQERHGDEDHPLSSVFSRWIRRALQMEGAGFDSPRAAQIAFEEVLASNRRYVTGTGALEQWVESHGGFPKPVPPPGQAVQTAATVAVPPDPSALEGFTTGAAVAGEEPERVIEAPAPAAARLFGLPKWAAAVIMLVLLQAVVIGWYWTRPAPGPVAGEGELVVSSRPVGARVVVDGSDRGATPLTVTLPAGPHVIEVRAASGEPRVIPLVIRANVQTAQYVELQEATPPAKSPSLPTKRR